MGIVEWLDNNLIDYEMSGDDIFIANNESFLIINPKNGRLFDEDFQLILDEDEMEMAPHINNFTFCFGGKWYYFNKDSEPSLTPLKYIGKAKTNL